MEAKLHENRNAEAKLHEDICLRVELRKQIFFLKPNFAKTFPKRGIAVAELRKDFCSRVELQKRYTL